MWLDSLLPQTQLCKGTSAAGAALVSQLEMPEAYNTSYQFNNLAFDDHYMALHFLISNEAFRKFHTNLKMFSIKYWLNYSQNQEDLYVIMWNELNINI